MTTKAEREMMIQLAEDGRTRHDAPITYQQRMTHAIRTLAAEIERLERERDDARGCKPDAWEHVRASERMAHQLLREKSAEVARLRAKLAVFAAKKSWVPPHRSMSCNWSWNFDFDPIAFAAEALKQEGR